MDDFKVCSECIKKAEVLNERLTPLELIMDNLVILKEEVETASITTQEFIDKHSVLMREIRENIRGEYEFNDPNSIE